MKGQKSYGETVRSVAGFALIGPGLFLLFGHVVGAAGRLSQALNQTSSSGLEVVSTIMLAASWSPTTWRTIWRPCFGPRCWWSWESRCCARLALRKSTQNHRIVPTPASIARNLRKPHFGVSAASCEPRARRQNVNFQARRSKLAAREAYATCLLEPLLASAAWGRRRVCTSKA